MIYKSKEANEMMADYDENGLDSIIGNYRIEDIAEMILPDETSENNVRLSKLMVLLDGA